MSRIRDDHPLAVLLRELIHEAVVQHVASRGIQDAESYLASLLLEFMRADQISAIRDREGNPINSLARLVVAGDITAGADSFERERQVHKHVGDILMFGMGVYPGLVRELKGVTIDLEPIAQGKESYAIVSSYRHGEYAESADTFRKLSDGFEDFTWVLGDVGRKSGLVQVHRG